MLRDESVVVHAQQPTVVETLMTGLVDRGELDERHLVPRERQPQLDPAVGGCQSVVLDRDIKAASDDLRVIAAAPTSYDVTATLIMKPGPDSALVIADATARLQTYAASRRKVGAVVYQKGIEAALMTSAVDNLGGTIVDIDPGATGIATIGNINLTAHEPEFSAFQWVGMEDLPALIVPFKRDTYRAVISAFRGLL